MSYKKIKTVCAFVHHFSPSIIPMHLYHIETKKIVDKLIQDEMKNSSESDLAAYPPIEKVLQVSICIYVPIDSSEVS